MTLQHCAVLDAKGLDPFLHEELEYLDLSFCSQIKDRDIETISQRCPHLRMLYLNGCSGLRQIASSGVFLTAPLDFARQELKALKGHTRTVNALISLEGGKKIASAGYKTIHIWDIELGQELFSISHPHSIYALYAQEPDLLYVGDEGGDLWCWKLNLANHQSPYQLVWTTYPALDCSGVDIASVLNLSEANRSLMLKHGARN